jgi:hypothetical protein
MMIGATVACGRAHQATSVRSVARATATAMQHTITKMMANRIELSHAEMALAFDGDCSIWNV